MKPFFSKIVTLNHIDIGTIFDSVNITFIILIVLLAVIILTVLLPVFILTDIIKVVFELFKFIKRVVDNGK